MELPIEIWVQILDYLVCIDHSQHIWANEDRTRAEQFYRLQQLRSSSKFFVEQCTSYLISKHAGKFTFEINDCNWNPAASAAFNGHKNLLDLNKQYWSFTCYEAAIISNRMDIFNYLRENNCPDYDDLECLVVALIAGQMDFVKLFDADKYKELGHATLMDHVASNGHTELMKYFNTDFGIKIEPGHLVSAIRSKVQECIDYAVEYAKQNNTLMVYGTSFMAVAAETGNLDLLKRMHSLAVPWNYQTPEAAAQAGHVECLQYVLENGCSSTSDTIFYAISAGNTECIKVADKFGCGWPIRAQEIAVTRNKLECLKLAYIHDQQNWRCNLTNVAAKFGALDCLKYLHENGCEWTQSELNLAVAGRHMSCVKYLHEEQGMTWSELTCEFAAQGGELCDSSSDYFDRYLPIKKSAECLQYVHEQGAVWNERTCEVAALNDQIECLQYAHEHG